MYKGFVVIMIFIIGVIAWIAWDTSPSQSKMSNIDSVTIKEDSDSKFIKFVEDGEVKQLNIEAVDSIEISNKDFSYYSYFRPYYSLYLVEEDYHRIFKSVDKKAKDDLNEVEN